MNSFRKVTLVAIVDYTFADALHDDLFGDNEEITEADFDNDPESQLFSEEDVYTPEFLAKVIEERKSDCPFNI